MQKTIFNVDLAQNYFFIQFESMLLSFTFPFFIHFVFIIYLLLSICLPFFNLVDQIHSKNFLFLLFTWFDEKFDKINVAFKS